MKIAMICPNYGYIERGTENTTRQVSKRLKHDVDIFSLTLRGDIVVNGYRKDRGLGKLSNSFFENSKAGGFSRKYLGYNPNIEDIVFARNMKKMLEAIIDSYDLLWSNGEYWCAKHIVKLGKKYNKPTLLFFGGGISRMMLKEAKLLPDIFVVLTPEMKEWIESKVPNCNVKCIPCGADLEMFKPLKTSDTFEHPVVLSTAALIKGKRINLIINAMEKLEKGELIVTSDGPFKYEIVNTGEEKLGKRFFYAGKVKYDELPFYYNSADVMVLASKNEPFGMNIIESMACNTPVVVQEDKTRLWMVGNGGVVVKDCTKIKSLADAIELAYKRDFKSAPREMAKRFSWDKIAKQYEEAIKEITNEKTI